MSIRIFGLFVFIQLLALAPPRLAYAGDHDAHATPPAPQEAASCAADALDRLDRRTPVPLLPMMAHHQKEQMRDHLRAIQEIVEAVSRQSWAEVEAAAGRIGYSEGMAATCEHMGAAAPGFSEMALSFHRTADLIAEAARAKDVTGVLQTTAATVSVCTGCHETYKQQVVDENQWQRLTAPPGQTAR